MNHDWLFLPMRPSNDLLGDPVALHERLDEDSYLYFQGVIDPDRIMSLRRSILSVLAERGWIKGGLSLMEANAVCRPLHEGLEGYAPVYDAVQCLEEFHTLAHDDGLVDVMRQVVGETAFPHPLKIGRLGFPEHYEATTPPHQDFPNNQGTPDLTASWIPVGDIPRDLGGLAILRGSHRRGLLQLAGHMGPGRRQAVVPQRMLEELRWVTTDFAAGDVVLFPSLTVHAALHNITEFEMRLSVDFRYQQEGEPLTPICLEPHFQRLSWDEVYRNWSSDEHQYYWKDLDYEVVPFEDFPIVGADENADRNMGFTEEEWLEIMTVDKRWEARYQRRIERLAEVTGEPVSSRDTRRVSARPMPVSLYGLKRALHYPRTVYLRRTRPIAEDHIRAMFELNYYQKSLYDFTGATMAKPDILIDFDLDESSTVLDVGAFVGNWTEQIAERFNPTIYAFEPAPGPARTIERRVAGNPRVTVCPIGLSNADQTASLSLNGPGASMYADASKVKTTDVEIRDVAAVLDELDIELIDLLKVNIEGAEYDLFDRLIETDWLPRIRQIAVQFHEWHPQAYRRRRAIRTAFRRNHVEIWSYPWVWEYWRRGER